MKAIILISTAVGLSLLPAAPALAGSANQLSSTFATWSDCMTEAAIRDHWAQFTYTCVPQANGTWIINWTKVAKK